MIKKNLLIFLILSLLLSLLVPTVVTAYFQPNCEEFPEEFPEECGEGGGEEGEPDYCEINPEYCEEGSEADDDDDGEPSGPPWPGYSDGRLNPDPAEYYTIYCHEGTDTIYVVRVVPVNETIKEIPLADAIALDVGHELPLGDFMVMERGDADTITIYGSNGNLAPNEGSKSFSLNECINSNGGPPNEQDTSPPPDDDDGQPLPEQEEETEAEAFRRRQREAQESLDFCYVSYDFFGGDAELLVWCLDSVLSDYADALPGEDILTLIVMVFCLNLMVGNGVLPIGIVVLLGWHRRWLRKWKVRK